jgi:hypothetical protein
LLVPPSSKVQFQLVGLPVERSVKLTGRGTHPEFGVALKAATGASLQVLSWGSEETVYTPSVAVTTIVRVVPAG